MRIFFLFTFLILVSCTSKLEMIQFKNIKIARDSYGASHIFAKTDAEVAYGLVADFGIKLLARTKWEKDIAKKFKIYLESFFLV